MFHASWCSWCKRLDTALASPELRGIIHEHFILTHIDVLERKGKIDSIENPGGNALLKSWDGEKSGIPYLVFLNAGGKKIADSNVMPNHENIGYPGSKEEIAAFVSLLQHHAPRMTTSQLAAVNSYFLQHAPKQ